MGKYCIYELITDEVSRMDEPKTYQHINTPPQQRPILKEALRHIDWFECCEYAVSLLLCKTSLLGAMSPFGIAFFGATLLRQRWPLGILFSILGTLLAGQGVISFKYVGGIIVFAIFSLILKKELCDKKYLLAGIAAFAMLANGLMFLMFKGFLLYDFLQLLAECTLTFVSFLAFDKAILLLRNLRGRTVFEPDETLSLVILAGCVILSIATIPYLRSVSHVLSIYIILVLSLCSGFGVSASAGVLLGLINSMGAVMSSGVIGVYAFCGLFSGLCRRLGKWGVTCAFLLANAAIMLYLNNSTDQIITIYYVAVAGTLLFATPQKYLAQFGKVMHIAQDAPTQADRTKQHLSAKLTEASQAFYGLSDIFASLVAYRVNTDIKDVTVLFDRVAQDVCASCSMNTHCWQQGFNNTYNLLMQSFEEIERKGFVAENCMPKRFLDQCIRAESFVDAYAHHYALYKSDVMWAGKVLESRELVADQFKNVSHILGTLRDELACDITYDEQLAQKLHAGLDQHGIRATDLTVSNGDGYEVQFTMKACGGSRRCATATSILSELLEVPMRQIHLSCGEKQCRITFREQAKYRMDVGMASTCEDGQKQSGDNYTFLPIDDNKYLLALSDGMGSGKSAKAQSEITIDLLKRLLEAGFDRDTAIRLINSVLLLRTDKESFATIDMCLANLYTGQLEFVKIGAAASYIKREGGTEQIDSTSLPAGIVRSMEPEHDFRTVRAGETIVMVTDGVTDCEQRHIKNADAIRKLIDGYQGLSSQELADLILQTALSLSGGVAEDDMTVLVATVRESA